jgi:tripartite-type tricarboxylate transporter receptor subunit TctC
MKHGRIRFMLAAGFGLAVATSSQATTHDFYKGKTMRIIVGFAPGGGFDTYSRTIARHIGKHIPGSPTVIVENMDGAGSRIAANHLYKVAKPDGLTIANFIGGILMDQILERPGAEYDALKFEYLGTPLKDNRTCTLTKASGITSMEKWMASKTPVKLGGIGPGTGLDDAAKVLKVALGLPVHLVSGYKGTSQVRLAAESGEVAGACGWSWDSVRATWAKAIESGDAVVVLQNRPTRHQDLPNVPLAGDYAKSEEARLLIKVGINDPADMNRIYALPPGTPKERVQLLRKALMDTFKDAEFLAEAKKTKLDIDSVTGEELERTIAGLFKLEPKLVGKLKEILK